MEQLSILCYVDSGYALYNQIYCNIKLFVKKRNFITFKYLHLNFFF